MRKIIVISMITLDGVMQAPGRPEEDISGGLNMAAGLRRILPKLTKRLVSSWQNK